MACPSGAACRAVRVAAVALAVRTAAAAATQVAGAGDPGAARPPSRPATRAALAALTAHAAAGAEALRRDELRRDELRRDLLRRLNEERAAAGAPPLRPVAALDRAAQQHVDELVAAGSLEAGNRPEQAMQRRLREAGYDARQWAENVMSGPAGAAQLVATWREDDTDGTFRRLLEPAYTDLGIGFGRLDGSPVYSILFAEPESAAFARDTAGLRDLERVRAELLTRIDAERRRARRQPLALDTRLDLAAQRHAEDMLARSYFAHRGPSGTTVRERARAAGYEWSAIGENLAEGQQSVKEVVEGWMRSAAHRENILDRRFTQTGVGLALGRDPKTGEYRILWVQTFGLPR